MNRMDVEAIERRIANGEAVSEDDITGLISAFHEVHRAAMTPSEYVVRVARDSSRLDRWTAQHPLIPTSNTAGHPADALILGAVELRRLLPDHDGPNVTSSERSTRRIDRSVADAHRRSDEPGPRRDSLAWALDEVDRLASELATARDDRLLRDAAAAGDADARRAQHAAERSLFHAANVRTTDHDQRGAALGDASQVGLELPSLVLAIDLAEGTRVQRHRFTPDREWFALTHRTAPRPMSSYMERIVTPLRIGADIELALRRLAPRVPTGRNIGKYIAFQELIEIELPDVDVSFLDSNLSPAWVPLPLDALPVLCSGTPDKDVDTGSLVDHDEPFCLPRWELAWITTHSGESDWGW